jgi:FtsZ-interacting cell division protein ZipA
VTTLISITLIVILVIALALVVPMVRRKNREANVARAEQLRSEAATSAQTVLPPAQARAAETEASAAEARAIAERAEAEAEQARLAASQAEAEHEDRIRAADRLDPRVDHQAEDYAPQVPGTDDLGPTPPAEVNAEPATETTPAAPAETPADTSTDAPRADEPPSGGAPLLPRRTPGANEMPGKPMESEGGGGGWFTRKDSTDS